MTAAGAPVGRQERAEVVPEERAAPARPAAVAPEMVVGEDRQEAMAKAAASAEPAEMAGAVVLPAALAQPVDGAGAAVVPQVDGAGAVSRLPRAASAVAKRPAVRGARQTAASSRAGSTPDSARSAFGAAAAEPGRWQCARVTRSAPLTRSAPSPARCAAATPATRRLGSASTPVFAPAAEMRPRTKPSMSDVLRS